MSSKRYTQEFKVEAVKQVTDRGHSLADVASRLGISILSLYAWQKQYANPSSTHPAAMDQASELRRVKSEFRRVTQERDVQKRPQRTLPSCSGEVRVHARSWEAIPPSQHV